MIIFGLVRFLLKKITKLNLKKKTETKPKPVQTSLARFFPVWLGFFPVVFFVWIRFGLVFSVSGL
jgi:hypothetical protein